MSLYEEMLEQNSRYQAVMQENEALQARVATLEQLVSDYYDFVAPLSLTAIPRTKRDALQERAKAVLNEGK